MTESNRHGHGSAWGWIGAWLGVVLLLVTGTCTVILAFGQEWLGVSLGVLLIWELVGRVGNRFRYAMHGDEIEARAEEIIASQTGTWRLFVQGEAPLRFTCRWDAWERQYVTESRTEDGFNMGWPDSLTMARVIADQERAGWAPNDDEATRGIRGRLDLAAFKREDTL